MSVGYEKGERPSDGNDWKCAFRWLIGDALWLRVDDRNGHGVQKQRCAGRVADEFGECRV